MSSELITEPQRYFFIVGCQRSGTTLLRLVLESHSKIFCYDEIHGYRALMMRDFSESQESERVGFKIPRWTEQLTQAQLGDEGQEEVTPNFYAGQKILFMLRDVRDTVTSMLTLKTGDDNWLTTYGRRILAAKMQDDTFRQRYATEIALMDSASDKLVAAGAFYWKYKTQAYFDYQARGFPLLGIRYEHLVTYPEVCLRSILEFLELEWEDALQYHAKLEHREVYPNGLTVGNTDPAREIDAKSVNSWVNKLRPDQEAIILDIAGELHDRIRWT